MATSNDDMVRMKQDIDKIEWHNQRQEEFKRLKKFIENITSKSSYFIDGKELMKILNDIRFASFKRGVRNYITINEEESRKQLK